MLPACLGRHRPQPAPYVPPPCATTNSPGGHRDDIGQPSTRHVGVMASASMKMRIITSTAAIGAVLATATAGGQAGADSVELTPLGVYDSGVGEGGSEIVAVDTFSDRMFITNGEENRIDVVDISDPGEPTLVTTVQVDGGIQSVAVGHKIAAAAVQGDGDLDNGSVVVFDTDGHIDGEYEVGNLPDSIAFTPNGRYIVVANEAEPVCTSDDTWVDPRGSVSIIDVRKGTVADAGFERWDGEEDALRNAGVRIFFPGSSASQDLEPEYVTVANNSKTAYVTLQENNAVAVVDIKSATVTDIVPLGYKDHSVPGFGLDPSNEDDAEATINPNVLGMYMPDAIAFANLDAGKFLVTANEGDARDYDCFSEEVRVKDFEAGEGTETADGTEIMGLAAPYTADDLDDERLGRLKTTTAFPTSVDTDGRVEQIYSYGARSFTIWDLGGNIVFDSGDDFEDLLRGTPYYNLDEDETDGRSDDKGAEPEALALGEVDGRDYAFVGLERSGGIAMYDITDPANSTFVDYVNTEPEGDISPEGIAFVPADKSPTGTALIAVSFEVSGTTRLFEVG